MKKVSLVALIAAFTATTAGVADSTPAHCPKAFQGIHLGGNIGIGLGTGIMKTNVYTNANPALSTGSTKTRLGVLGFDGGINTGYTYRMNNFLMGLEFVANWTSSKGSETDPTTTLTAKLKNSLQLRANFGYVIANLVAPKFIIGWDASNWNITTKNSPAFSSANINSSKYLNGFLIGVGVDFLATKHFILGMDTTLSMYNGFKKSFPLGTTQTQAYSFKPQPYGKISVVAKFIY